MFHPKRSFNNKQSKAEKTARAEAYIPIKCATITVKVKN